MLELGERGRLFLFKGLTMGSTWEERDRQSIIIQAVVGWEREWGLKFRLCSSHKPCVLAQGCICLEETFPLAISTTALFLSNMCLPEGMPISSHLWAGSALDTQLSTLLIAECEGNGCKLFTQISHWVVSIWKTVHETYCRYGKITDDEKRQIWLWKPVKECQEEERSP